MASRRRIPLHAPTNANLSGTPALTGLTVSPQSKLSAADIVRMIKQSDKLPDQMKKLFIARGNRILVLEGDAELPPGMDAFPDWFTNAAQAINRGFWHLTTATANVDRSALFMQDKVAGDYEPGDEPVAGPRTTGLAVGETVPTEAGASFMGLRKMVDENAQGGPRSPLRRPSTDSVKGEGLVVIATRWRDIRHQGSEVPRPDGAILETFFHELGGHAELIDRQQSAEHSSVDYYVAPITDADLLAKAVHDFFGNPPEDSLIQQATVNFWDRVKQDGSPPSTGAPSTSPPGNIWDRIKSSD